MAYARRAASLAEDLAEWHQIYARRERTTDPWVYNSSDRAALTERVLTLQRLVGQLNDVASELVALR
jgi:hypothetical protein